MNLSKTFGRNKFKNELKKTLKNIINRSIVAKFRISAHRLRIETGRYHP
jgi:hypothetical protein